MIGCHVCIAKLLLLIRGFSDEINDDQLFSFCAEPDVRKSDDLPLRHYAQLIGIWEANVSRRLNIFYEFA